jgi:recombinational DNA repair ATPase RecF
MNNNNTNTLNMSNTIYKHRNCIITTTPTQQYPEMVTVIKTPKLREDFLNRRYLTLKHAHKAIELFESERLIKTKTKYIKSQLQDVVVLDEMD